MNSARPAGRVKSFFFRRWRLLSAAAGVAVSLALAAIIVGSELDALPGGVGWAFRHKVATVILLEIGKILRCLDDL